MPKTRIQRKPIITDLPTLDGLIKEQYELAKWAEQLAKSGDAALLLPSIKASSIALNHTARLLVMRQKLSGEPADDLLAALEQAATQVVDSMLEKHADEEEGQT